MKPNYNDIHSFLGKNPEIREMINRQINANQEGSNIQTSVSFQVNYPSSGKENAETFSFDYQAGCYSEDDQALDFCCQLAENIKKNNQEGIDRSVIMIASSRGNIKIDTSSEDDAFDNFPLLCDQFAFSLPEDSSDIQKYIQNESKNEEDKEKGQVAVTIFNKSLVTGEAVFFTGLAVAAVMVVAAAILSLSVGWPLLLAGAVVAIVANIVSDVFGKEAKHTLLENNHLLKKNDQRKDLLIEKSGCQKFLWNEVIDRTKPIRFFGARPLAASSKGLGDDSEQGSSGTNVPEQDGAKV